MRLSLILAALAGLTACEPASAPPGPAPAAPEPAATVPSPTPTDPVEEPTPPPRRNVIVSSDPAPPHTYWAPEGSEIRGHQTNPGIWIAYVDGRQVGYYFGDECGASRRQDWIGMLRSELPARPANEDWRVYETGEALTEDLRVNRTNIEIDPDTQRVVSISCH